MERSCAWKNRLVRVLSHDGAHNRHVFISTAAVRQRAEMLAAGSIELHHANLANHMCTTGERKNTKGVHAIHRIADHELVFKTSLVKILIR